MLNFMEPNQEEKNLILMGLETMQISRQGYYQHGTQRIYLANEQHHDFEQAVVYAPQKLEKLDLDSVQRKDKRCKIRVVNDDSLHAAHGMQLPLVMNFANGRRPGGGFLFGAKAQEESICRASTLYLSVSSEKASEMYEHNRKNPSPVDSDYMVLSPEVCVFRNPKGYFLNAPYYAAVITVPAPDKAQRASHVPQAELDRIMKNRLRNMLTVAACHGYQTLILGAWGCGAFGNEAGNVAEYFYDLLIREKYADYFDGIVFAILGDQEKREVFRKTFADCSA